MKANACSGGSLWVPSLSAIKMSNLLTSNGKTNLYAQIFKNLAKQTLNRLKHRHTHTHTHFYSMEKTNCNGKIIPKVTGTTPVQISTT